MTDRIIIKLFDIAFAHFEMLALLFERFFAHVCGDMEFIGNIIS